MIIDRAMLTAYNPVIINRPAPTIHAMGKLAGWQQVLCKVLVARSAPWHRWNLQSSYTHQEVARQELVWRSRFGNRKPNRVNLPKGIVI